MARAFSGVDDEIRTHAGKAQRLSMPDSDDDHDMHIMLQILEDFREKRLSPSEREALMRAAGGQFTQLLTQHWKEKIQPTQVAGISLPPCLRSGLCCTDQSGEHSPYST